MDHSQMNNGGLPIITAATGWRDVAVIGIALFAGLQWKPAPLAIIAGLVTVSIIMGLS